MSPIAAIVTKCDSSKKLNVICWIDGISSGSEDFNMLEVFRDKYYPEASVQLVTPNFVSNEIVEEDRLHIKFCDIEGINCNIICDHQSYKTLRYRNSVSQELINVIIQNNECVVL